MLGYPEAALADTENALNDVREIGQAATLMYALVHASITHIYCGNYAAANAEDDELLALADEEGALQWKPRNAAARFAFCPDRQGRGRCSNDYLGAHCLAVDGGERGAPSYLSYLASAAELRQFGDARVEITKERLFEAEVNRLAGEIVLKSPEPDAAKAQAYFDRALAVAHQQRASPGNCARR